MMKKVFVSPKKFVGMYRLQKFSVPGYLGAGVEYVSSLKRARIRQTVLMRRGIRVWIFYVSEVDRARRVFNHELLSTSGEKHGFSFNN